MPDSYVDIPTIGDAREHYVDVGPGILRKNDDVADAKYEGIRTTRKKLMEESEEADSDGRADEDDEEEQEGEIGSGRNEDEVVAASPPETEDYEVAKKHTDERTISDKVVHPIANETSVDDITSTMQKTREQDRRKGEAVTRQISLWDTLLDARIRLQKAMTTVNRLPVPSDIGKYSDLPECQQSIENLMEETVALSEDIFELQEKLMAANQVAALPPRKRRRLQSSDATSGYTSLVTEATTEAVMLEQSLHPYMLQTLSKWSSKIQAVTPSVLLPSNRGAFSKNNHQDKSAVELIDEILLGHDKLVTKTQIRRTREPRIGAINRAIVEDGDEGASKEDPEVFDDTDFYQKLLRDVIDARTGGGGEQDDWMLIQRQKKAKKKVDTKASKGRKLRYEVHEKIQNFMVPVPIRGAWHEEQIDELFASLLGKDLEDTTLEAETEKLDRNALKGGFRLFG